MISSVESTHKQTRDQVSSGYVRFHVETSPAPPRRKDPHPFYPKVRKLGLARLLLGEALEYGLKLRHKAYRDALLSRPCIYGVFSGKFGGFSPIKEKCTGCMRCVQEYPGVCTVDRNPAFFKFADSYWIPADQSGVGTTSVATVSYEATTGKIPIKGMGYKGNFAAPGWDSIWTDMSEIVRPTRDGVYGREYISTAVDIGRKPKHLDFIRRGINDVSRTIEAPIPIIFDNLPPNLNNPSIIASIARTSTRIGTYFIAKPSQVNDLAQAHRGNWIPLLDADEVDQYRDMMAEAPAVEFTSFNPDAVIAAKESNPKALVAVRLRLDGDSPTAAAELAREDVDVVHIFANYHGQGWNAEGSAHAKDLIRRVHGSLVKESIRDEVTLIASGGIILAEHVPKAIICGADVVGLDSTVLVALQVELLSELRTPESGRIKDERFDAGWGEQRLVNLLGSWHDQLIEILSAMGMRDVRRLRGDVGRAMFNDDLEKEAFSDIARAE